MNHARFYRGTAASSREGALKSGLSMLNESSQILGDSQSSHGGFFYVDGPDIAISSAEEWARMVAKKEKKVPCVIDIPLEPRTREILQGRVYQVRIDPNVRGSVGYEMIDVHREEARGIVTINLSRLAHEELVNLGLKVGFPTGSKDFEYKTYQEWTQMLEVRQETRQELAASRFGRRPGWMK